MSEELKKIMYVEDDTVVAEIVIMTLEDMGGFKVMYCSSGREALDKIVSYSPDLVLLDMMMPEMDGVETCKLLRKIPEVKDIPIIFITAKVQQHEQDIYIKLGAIGVIAKPFDPMNLCKVITDLWNKNHE